MATREDIPAVIHRLQDAMNRHDLDALVECFDTDFRSEQPAHPARAFRGNEQVRKNWSTMFHGIPDFEAEVLGAVSAGDMVWT